MDNNGTGTIADRTIVGLLEDIRDAGGAGGGSGSYQPLDSDLTAIAALSTTSFGRSLLTLANAAALLSTAGAQASDSDLTAFAALTPSNDDVVQRKAGVWANRTLAQLMMDLVALGTPFQPLDSDLTAIAALATTSAGRSLLLATAATAAGLGLTNGAAMDSWAAITRASGFDTFATTPSSANLAALLTDEIGSGKIPLYTLGVDGTSPVAPLLVPFVAFKTGMSMLTGGNGATVMAVSLPSGASGLRVLNAWFEITAVTSPTGAAFRFNIVGNNGILTGSVASSSTTPAVGQMWDSVSTAQQSPIFKATSGNITVTITTPFTGTAVTATLFLNCVYVP
jgi:hypothetical protein